MKILNYIQFKPGRFKAFIFTGCLSFLTCLPACKQTVQDKSGISRERISINEGWHFFMYDSIVKSDSLIYDVRPDILVNQDYTIADAKPTEAEKLESTQQVLKPWILPSGNYFIKDSSRHYVRPAGDPGNDFPFVKGDFNDESWEEVDLPHDWAIKGPFMQGQNAIVGGSMGRLPSPGVAWYRKKLDISESDAGKSIFLDVDGAMSYAMVWLNGHLVGGWPFGYSSWRLDLTPYIIPGGENQLAIRLDNPNNSSRWYPGGGIYRNVWLVKTNSLHVAHWGTFITTRDISEASATIEMEIIINNDSKNDEIVTTVTEIFALDSAGNKIGKPAGIIKTEKTNIKAKKSIKSKGSITVENPRLWGPPPTQNPNLYIAVTNVVQNKKIVDQYETRFGIRSLRFDSNKGIIINGEHIPLKGVNQHHDLGALGAAFNFRAAERQLETLKVIGCNAIRMSHNPPAPELLELTDKMGFLVMDEAYDVWERKKNFHDFHLIFPEWHEQDLRALIRRDRNCPSVIIWSFGNEVGEQYTDIDGAKLAQHLHDISKEEDPTRPTTASMNWAKPNMPFPAVMDIISLNYQGEGIRQDPIFEGTDRIRTAPQYPFFHRQFPDKVILSSETASTFSSRGIYFFPVTDKTSTYIRDGRGGDSKIQQVSSYGLYAVDFGSSPNRVFSYLDQHPFVAGQFVWTGWDHLGEPTPYYGARSSYCGIIDLAGFKKDMYYLYQSQWKPELAMAHILPHWNWPERIGEITPVHVFTSGDEAELFLNGKSLGKKKMGEYEYRLRWDEVIYEPGELKVIAYKKGKRWAEDVVKTTGKPKKLEASADQTSIKADGKDLAFIAVKITDTNGLTVPRSDNEITFMIEGPGRIVATDNGDPTDFTPFPANIRKAFNGLALVIVQSQKGETGTISIKASSPGLDDTRVEITSK